MLIKSCEELRSLDVESLPARREPDRILMCDPMYFSVIDVKNAFMQGKVNSVDSVKAGHQWAILKHTFEGLGYTVEVIAAQPGLEDMVFTANQVLVGETPNNAAYVVPSVMKYPSRQREVPYYKSWFKSKGYTIMELPAAYGAEFTFEGHGDAIWHPGKQLLWGGFGHRTNISAYEQLQKLISVPIIVLNLVHDVYYHLDTAFCVLDKDFVMLFPPAFTDDGLQLIKRVFANVIEVTHEDANNFACNALALGRNVVLQHGSKNVCTNLRKHGFEPVEVETSEFMKSGGSVFCLKMLFYNA